MTGLRLTLCACALFPVAAFAQEAQLTKFDAGALYALSSVAGARPNCKSLIASEQGATGISPEEPWLHWDEASNQWQLVRSSIDPGRGPAEAITSIENALALFIVCGIPPRSDNDLVRLTDAIQDASSRWVPSGSGPEVR